VSRKRGVLAFAILALVLATVAALGLWSLVHRDQRAKIGEEILYDDFGFRVQSVRTAAEVGPASNRVRAAAGESLVIVRYEVENHARRVEFDLSSQHAVLEDGGGRVFDVDTDATRALAEESHAVPAPAKIRAGDFTSSDLVFRVPDGASSLHLRVKWNTEPMAGLDQAVFGDRTIVLGR
jgi:hypothetical protein